MKRQIPKLSSITVINSSGVSVDAGPTVVVPGHPLELEVPLRPIGNGVYTVTWKTVSETDGHLATGAYAFGVGESAASANAHASKSVVSPPPSVLAVVARWLFFIGLMGIVGVASTCLIALRDIPKFATRNAGALWLVGALGVAGIVEAQREAAGVELGRRCSRRRSGCIAVERVAAHRGDRHGCRRHVDCTCGRIACRSRAGGHRRSDLDVGGCRCEPRGCADAGGDQSRCPVGAHRRGRGLDRRAVDPPPGGTGPTVGASKDGRCAGSQRSPASPS